MLKNGLIVIALMAIAGGAMAAGSGTSSDNTSSSSRSSSLVAEFHRLDTNHNGILTRREAQADPKVARIYGSLDTNNTIQKAAKNDGRNGITLSQFVAGMEAARHGGVVGKPVSGGGTYVMMKDGRKIPLSEYKKMAGGQSDGQSASRQ